MTLLVALLVAVPLTVVGLMFLLAD